MNKVYWSFGDLKKRASFLTMNTLDISNTNFVKVKMNRLKKLQFMENLPKIGPANFISER